MSPVEQHRSKTGNASKYNFVKVARFHRPMHRQPKDIVPDIPVREVTQAETAWYQNLPEKIKRNQFTLEERHQFTPKDETHHVVDATEELFYKLGARQPNRSLPSLSSNSDGEGDDSTFDEVIDTPLDVHDATFDHFQALDSSDSDPPIGHHHDNYHPIIAHSPSNPRRPSTAVDGAAQRKHSVPNFSSPRPRKSLDRGRSFADLKSARQQSTSTQDSFPTQPPSFAPFATSSSDSSLRQSIFERRASRRHGNRPEEVPPPLPAIDADAAHVSDPATRLKLKLYLGSAAKFDEAIEFGFPATATLSPPASSRSFRRGSISSYKRRPSVSSYRSRRRSRSLSMAKPDKDTALIGTTFFMDDDEEDSATIVDDFLAHYSSPETTPVVEEPIHTFYAELPDNEAPPPALRPGLATPQTAPASVRTASTLPPHSIAPYPHRSQSTSLRPRQNLAVDTNIDQHQYLRPLMSAREKPLKPWIEPTDSFGEREMTLRLTLTRKDLRADESQIYPENGAGSWDAADQVAPTRNNDRWRFWQRKRS